MTSATANSSVVNKYINKEKEGGKLRKAKYYVVLNMVYIRAGGGMWGNEQGELGIRNRLSI